MVTVAPHIRASWGGGIGIPEREVWTNTINLMALTGTTQGSTTDAELAGRLPALRDLVAAWFTATSLVNSPPRGFSAIFGGVSLKWVKLNFIEADGTYRGNPNTLEFNAIQGPSTGPANAQMPLTLWQQSAVISLRTAVGRGRGSRGRIYPPLSGGGADVDGYMPAAWATGMQQNAVRLIGDLNKMMLDVAAPRFWNACVVSAARNGKPAMNTPITSLYVDRIPDIQRRRVNRLTPNAAAATSVYINT